MSSEPSTLSTAASDGPDAPQADGLADRPLRVDAYPEYAEGTFFAETVELFRSVRDHDFATLSARCDDDFGIVDIDTDGSSAMVRSRAEWESWFRGLFARMQAMQARTDTRITDYAERAGTDMGFSVVEFDQLLAVGDAVATFRCVTTIVWKRGDDRWLEARWHASLLSVDAPEGMVPG